MVTLIDLHMTICCMMQKCFVISLFDFSCMAEIVYIAVCAKRMVCITYTILQLNVSQSSVEMSVYHH